MICYEFLKFTYLNSSVHALFVFRPLERIQFFAIGSLGCWGRTGGARRPDSGEGGPWQRGQAGEEARGGRAAPAGGLSWGRGGLWRRRHGSSGAAAWRWLAGCGPVRWGGSGQASGLL